MTVASLCCVGAAVLGAGPRAETAPPEPAPVGTAGPLGLVIVLTLLVVTALLIRNMNARLRRLPSSFPPREQAPEEDTGRRDDGDPERAP